MIKVIGQIYIGSALKGRNRLASYYWHSVLTRTKKSLIYNSILKYGHENFSVIILEVCDANDSISERSYLHKESFHINYALSTYKEKVMNILPVVGFSLGYKHTKNSRLKMSLSHNKPIIITNVVSGETCTYSSIK